MRIALEIYFGIVLFFFGYCFAMGTKDKLTYIRVLIFPLYVIKTFQERRNKRFNRTGYGNQ
jgi:hypothetical protein